MSLPVVFHELAEEELNEAAAYYGRCVPQRSTPRGGSADQFTARRNGRGRGRAVVAVGAISLQHPLPRSAGPDSSACRRTPEAPTPLLARQAMSSARVTPSDRPVGFTSFHLKLGCRPWLFPGGIKGNRCVNTCRREDMTMSGCRLPRLRVYNVTAGGSGGTTIRGLLASTSRAKSASLNVSIASAPHASAVTR